MKINIAVVQFYITQLSPEINLKRAETFVKKASHLKADVIVFPEDFITGPILGQENMSILMKRIKIFL